LLLEINFWKVEGLVHIVGIVIHDIFSGRLIDQLSHGESLDGFILTDLSSAVEAGNGVGMTLVLLTSSVVSSL
jgi:hypothetical protein